MGQAIKLPVQYSKLSPYRRRQVREQYIQEQDGRCRHCNGALSGKPEGRDANRSVRRDIFPPGFFTHPIHLHHDHKTGWTLGAVHAHCNAVLFQYYGE